MFRRKNYTRTTRFSLKSHEKSYIRQVIIIIIIIIIIVVIIIIIIIMKNFTGQSRE